MIALHTRNRMKMRISASNFTALHECLGEREEYTVCSDVRFYQIHLEENVDIQLYPSLSMHANTHQH